MKMDFQKKLPFDCPATISFTLTGTLPFKMFSPFWSVWCKMALAEVAKLNSKIS
jgi:hypothetical protein